MFGKTQLQMHYLPVYNAAIHKCMYRFQYAIMCMFVRMCVCRYMQCIGVFALYLEKQAEEIEIKRKNRVYKQNTHIYI